ncbi:MAG: class I SAM-dependent methyltransferase [Clostridium sp.]|nr:class I SAM-dependent methyltransferase [Clostridium sp.]
MKDIIRQIPLYRFLKYCNETGMDKNILDCGAGGDCPPLSLFADYGYITRGIEFSKNQLEKAKKFQKDKGQNLNIELGDMRNLKFKNESFSFIYSYNSIFHMSKIDIQETINEFNRILKSGGLMFVNFLTTSDYRCGNGEELGKNQYNQMDDGVPIIHSYFEENEPDKFFENMEIIYKENRVLERIYEGEKIKQGFVDYIVKKV